MSSEPTPPAPSEGLPQGSATDMQNILLGSVSGTRPATQPGQPWVPPTPEELQKLLPQYEIHAMLGRGGMGAVYQARQVSLDRMAAIKILSNDLENMDASFSERFKNEARAMARLSHPGIIAVYDFGQTETGLLYIVMEFVEGTDVHQMISASGRLHTEHAMAITAHVCDALHYAHERGIIHRDIKPANIMVGYDGSVKVADFGLAKVNVGGETLGLTQSGMAMGTPHYIAPEALILGSQTDRRADIYAVGVMLYHMLTGKLPQGLFELPSIQVPGLDPRYDGIIARAMREDRELRYATAADMRADLDSILTQPVPKTEPEQSSNNAPAATLPHAARPQRPGAGQPHRPSPRPQPQVVVHTERKSSPLPWLAMLATGGVAAWMFLAPEKRQDAAPSAKKATEPSVKASIPATAPEPPAVKAAPAPSPAQAAVAASPAPVMTEPAPPISMAEPQASARPSILTPVIQTPVPASNTTWQPLFPNDSLEGWKDASEGHSLTNDVLTCAASGRDLISPGQYGNFHLKFDVKLSPGANNGIGIWRELLPDGTDLDQGSGFEVQLLDDTAPEFARVSTWQKHGGIYHFKEPASSPMNAPGTWNAHEIRVEGTKVTVIINNVTVLNADLTTLHPLVTRRGPLKLDKKRGHLVFMGNKGPVEFRNVMIKDLDAPAAPSPSTTLAATPTLWTDTQGRTLTAKFLRIEDANAVLEINGKPTPVSLAQLSPESRQIALQLQQAQSPANSQFEWLVGSWRQTNNGRTPAGVVAFQADETALFTNEALRLQGRWSLAGQSMKVTWENDVRYELNLLDTGGQKIITGKGSAPNGSEFTIRMEKDAGAEQSASGSSTETADGWTALFPGNSLAGWTGDTRGYSVNNGILTSTTSGGDLVSPKEYGSFHLKFDLRLSPGANSGIGVWCASTPGEYKFLAHTGFEVQLIDDTSPTYTKAQPWHLHGSLSYFLAPKARPMQPAGTWNTHELRMEGTRITLIINDVTVLDSELPRGLPQREGSRRHRLDLSKKRGHIVICGMKGPVDFRNMQIKELP